MQSECWAFLFLDFVQFQKARIMLSYLTGRITFSPSKPDHSAFKLGFLHTAYCVLQLALSLTPNTRPFLAQLRVHHHNPLIRQEICTGAGVCGGLQNGTMNNKNSVYLYVNRVGECWVGGMGTTITELWYHHSTDLQLGVVFVYKVHLVHTITPRWCDDYKAIFCSWPFFHSNS